VGTEPPPEARAGSARPPLLAVSVLSAAVLAYEVLLTRLFAIVQWHHFAYMIISVALLGYGAAGTTVALLRERLVPRTHATFAAGAALFAVSAVVSFLIAERLPFNALEFLWDARQAGYLCALYALLLVPFYCAAIALCTAFTRYAEEAPRLYSFDILGAAAGSLGVIGGLFLFHPMSALKVVGGAGIGAALLARGGVRGDLASWGLIAAAIALLAFPGDRLGLVSSPYKDLSQALQVSSAKLVAERSSPLGFVTVVESPAVPFRHAPGLSLAAPAGPPAQLGVFTDGNGFSAIDRFTGERASIAYLDWLPSALPYHLLTKPSALVLGSGAGSDVLQAWSLGAGAITAVELNPDLVELVQQDFGAFSGRPYALPGVTVHVGEARGFVAASDMRYDLIQVALLDAFGAASASVYSLSESYLYTVEALQLYLRHLAPGGYLAITRWMTLPPRDLLKLFATAIAALERAGVPDPAARLALVRGMRTATLLVKNGPITAEEVERIKEFARERAFDTAYYPGIGAAEGERFNRLDRPYFAEATRALLGPDRASWIDRYKFMISPATDDRPYFHRFFKWSSLWELLGLKEEGALPLVEWGYPVLVATLAQALTLSAVLILLPLVLARRRLRVLEGDSDLRVGGYFAAIGTAFMFIEIAYIQKFVLFLSHPLYAVAVALAGFLFFAGLGSRFAARMAPAARGRAVTIAIAAIVVTGVVYLLALPVIFPRLMGWPDAAKVVLALVLIAPLALPMGLPFPVGLASVHRIAPRLVPWAWGVNAFASVIAAILATLVAMHIGFSAVVSIALMLYGVAAMLAPRDPVAAATS
jgi:spermidine synthase